MELLLKRTVPALGRVGEIVKVKPGYARNFLLPRGLAVAVTKANIAMIERERERIAAEEAAEIGRLKDVVAGMVNVSVTLEGHANEKGHLFGSVTAGQIAHALQAKGYRFDERAVKLDSPIKEIGVYDVVVQPHPDASTTIKVWVVQSKPV
jgi:large subunit ribosomal protein L9